MGSVAEVAGFREAGLHAMRDFASPDAIGAQRAPVRCRVSEGKPVLLQEALFLGG